MKDNFSFFHCSSKWGILPSEWARTKLTFVLCWAENCTNTKVDVKQAQITTCARSATLFRLNLPCRTRGHEEVRRHMERGSSPTLFQEKMEEKMYQSSRSHPSRDSCTGRSASFPIGKASWWQLDANPPSPSLTLTPCPYAHSFLLVNCSKRLCWSVSFLLHFSPPSAIPIEMGTIPGQGLSAAPRPVGSPQEQLKSTTAKPTLYQNNTRNYKELPMGSLEPLHIFVLVCFGPLLDIQEELGWESHFLWKQRGFLCYPSQCTQPQGFVL